jgi:trehalose-6-phosphate synthase
VALINSLRDGMNLVSYEYVACQARRHLTAFAFLSLCLPASWQ